MRAMLVIAAVGCTAAAAPPIANIASVAPERQQLTPLVVDGFAGCVPHRIELSIDARRRSTVTITCPAPPPRRAGGRVVVVVCDGMPRTFDGAAVAIEPGRHTIAVRDELTGRTAQVIARFPVTRADTIVIGDDDRAIAVGVARRALLIFM